MPSGAKRVLLQDRFLTESSVLFSAMSAKPGLKRRRLIDRTIRLLKGAGVWARLDMLYVIAAHDAQAARLNWVAPGTNTLTAINSPSFALDRGYTGNGTDSYLDTGKDVSTLLKFSRNDAHLGGWALTPGTASRILLGSGTNLRLRNNNATTEREARVNTTTSISTDDNVSTGDVVAVRLGANDQRSYRNGGSETTSAGGSAAVTSETIYLLRNSTSYSDAQIAFAHFGSQLSTADVLAFYNIKHSYLRALGAL